MANHKSAAKRTRQDIKKTLVNRVKVSKTRNIIKKIREAIAQNNKDLATELFPKTQGLLARLAQAGNIKRNQAARVSSRLMTQISRIK